MDQERPGVPWYKTGAGTTFLTILGILSFLFVGFAGMTGYYAWQLKYGDKAALDREFTTKKFTTTGTQEDYPSVTPALLVASPLVHAHTPTTGEQKVPVTIYAFIDFECPYCQESYPTFKHVMDTYAPVTHIVFKHFPVESIHPRSIPAALAAACANEQGKFWPYYDLLFTHKQLDDESLLAYARQVGVNQTTFARCFSTQKYLPQIEQDRADGVRLGVRGTPTYIVNTSVIEGSISKQEWDTILLDYLQQ
ncbi:MAG TPA: thioredoxin domain-containing protein [Candidatus Kapabacteria bacterium]|nr:thioredoxin domain-containing protein [Candidatus Kapabacteria bacterium]